MTKLNEFYDTSDINFSDLPLDDVVRLFDMIAIYMFDGVISDDISPYIDNPKYINNNSPISKVSLNTFEEDYEIIHESAINFTEISKVLKYFVGRKNVISLGISHYLEVREGVIKYSKNSGQAFSTFSTFFRATLPQMLKKKMQQINVKTIGGLYE